jgi:hypothetical protein
MAIISKVKREQHQILEHELGAQRCITARQFLHHTSLDVICAKIYTFVVTLNGHLRGSLTTMGASQR